MEWSDQMWDPPVNDLDGLPIFQPRMGRDHRGLLVAVGGPGQGARRVVIKAHVARMSAGGAKADRERDTLRLHRQHLNRTKTATRSGHGSVRSYPWSRWLIA